MSRVGRLPVKIPAGVTVSFADGVLTVKGALGTLTQEVNPLIKVGITAEEVVFTRENEQKQTKALHGLYRALCHNMVEGVSKGYSKTLVIAGVGYKAVKQGNKIVLSLGFSHTVDVEEPAGITFEVTSPTEVVVKGASKELVGQTAANIKAIRKVEPYHGYGIHYKDEHVVRKEGKTAGK